MKRESYKSANEANRIKILEAKTVSQDTDLNLSPQYHKEQEQIAKALSHIGDMDILILKANYPQLYGHLIDIAIMECN